MHISGAQQMTIKRRDSIQERINSDGSTTYRAQVRIQGFASVSKSFSRRTDAKRWIEETKTAMRSGTFISTEADRTTLKEALERYLREVVPLKKGKKREADRVRTWMKHPLAVRFMSHLRGADFAEHRDLRRAEGRAENTIRLELALISAVYKRASREWKMEGLRNPIKNVTLPAGSNERKRRLKGDEEQKLLAALKALGPFYAPLSQLAIETAMRQGELLSLTAGDVDLDKHIARLKDTKNGEPREVALSTSAVNIIKALPRPFASSVSLFPLSQDDVIRTFKQACADAGIENLKFHDLRHESVSRLFERGLSLPEVAAISGHKTWSQLKRYTQLKAEDLARKLA
jgi:integrase